WLSFSGAALLAPRFIHTFSAAVVGIILVLLPALALSNLYKMVFSPASTLHSGLLATLVGAVILVISFILQVHFAPEDESAEHEGGVDVV
ncbi:hypothetical protein KAI87_07555, partial [Myxococcota bacterium]|nr:hypothetical protein [Myxococcota bacterium]